MIGWFKYHRPVSKLELLSMAMVPGKLVPGFRNRRPFTFINVHRCQLEPLILVPSSSRNQHHGTIDLGSAARFGGGGLYIYSPPLKSNLAVLSGVN